MPKANPDAEQITIRNVAPLGSAACSPWRMPKREGGYLTIGDPRDTSENLRSRGLTARNPRCWSPVISISRGEWDGLEPAAQAMVRKLVDLKAFVAENLPPEDGQ